MMYLPKQDIPFCDEMFSTIDKNPYHYEIEKNLIKIHDGTNLNRDSTQIRINEE